MTPSSPLSSHILHICALALWALSACSSAPPPTDPVKPAPAPETVEPADMVLVGGAIQTLDPERMEAEALAITGSRIVAVGTRADIEPRIGPDTRVIDLAGRSVSPGLSDAHCHLHGLGAALESVDLRGLTSPEAVADKLAQVAGRQAPGSWIVGRGWDQNLWPGQAFPTAAVLDAKVGEHPVAVRRIDGHALWANSAAMKAAGIDGKTADPIGGKVVRDARGRATGIFVDTAAQLVSRQIPAADTATIERRILAAADKALAAGITTVHEMGISDSVAQVYEQLAHEQRLPIRIYAFLSGDMEVVKTLAQRKPGRDVDGEAMYVMRAIKLYADGALGSRGAALLAPYADEPGNTGLWITSPEDLKTAAGLVAEAGWQLGVHAIGDAANRAVLDAYQAAIAEHSDADLRFRVEHAQVLAPADIGRFAEMDVIASMQPTHATSDMPWAPARLGADRMAGAYAWRSLIDSGARLAAGSDFPVEKVAPLNGIYAAVSRQDANGKPAAGFYPEQRLELVEALDAFTREPAYASFVEDKRGMLRTGYVADITVYDRELQADRSLLDTRIDLTIVGGQVRYQRER